jgi:protein-tyrosine phosphatase
MNILFVCTGNICRSPMAEAMLRHLLAERGVDGVTVSSSGTWGLDGEAATGLGIEELRGRGIVGSSPHIARSLTRDQLDAADLVVAMTSVHVRETTDRDPTAIAKTVLLKDLPAIEFRTDGGSPWDRLQALVAAPRPRWKRSTDVDDPMGLPSFAYKRTGDELWSALSHLVDALWPQETGDAETPRRTPDGP